MTSAERLEADVKSYAETIEELVGGNCEWFYDQYCDTDDEREEYGDSVLVKKNCNAKGYNERF